MGSNPCDEEQDYMYILTPLNCLCQWNKDLYSSACELVQHCGHRQINQNVYFQTGMVVTNKEQNVTTDKMYQHIHSINCMRT